MNTRTEPTLPWSATQDEQLRRLIRANIPASVIGYRLGRRSDSVVRRADELGLHVTHRRYDEAH